MHETYASKLLQQAVEAFSSLPGIGKKTALRMVLHLLRQNTSEVEAFAGSVLRLRQQVMYCRQCHNISDTELCNICSSARRDSGLICVVEDIRDVMAIENTGQYQGLYHVLGGIISPIDGIGPSDLQIESLQTRLSQHKEVSEVILALRTTMEGDTTAFYIFRKIQSFPVKVSAIARGVAIGDELEYADEITLGRSIANRTAYETLMSK